jgi:hypothetical protein
MYASAIVYLTNLVLPIISGASGTDLTKVFVAIPIDV